MTMGKIYKCIKKNKSGFEVGDQYIMSGESMGYTSDYDQLEPIDIILLCPNNSANWSKIKSWPKHNFEEYFKKIEIIRDEKIDQILNNDTKATD
jgi:hypothetical protein